MTDAQVHKIVSGPGDRLRVETGYDLLSDSVYLCIVIGETVYTLKPEPEPVSDTMPAPVTELARPLARELFSAITNAAMEARLVQPSSNDAEVRRLEQHIASLEKHAEAVRMLFSKSLDQRVSLWGGKLP